MTNAIFERTLYVPADPKTIQSRKAVEAYKQSMRDNVERAWMPPEVKRSQKAIMRLELDKFGEVSRLMLRNSSGDAKLNDSIWKAVAHAGKLPAPPEVLQNEQIDLFFHCHVAKAFGQVLPLSHHVYLQNPSYDNLDRQLFLEAVRARLERRWIGPKAAVDHTASVSFTAAKDGQLSKMHIIKSSGDPEMDRSILQTITDAGPFGPLPVAGDRELTIQLSFNHKAMKNRPPSNTVSIVKEDSADRNEFEHASIVNSYLEHLQKRVDLSFIPPQQAATETAVATFDIERAGAVANLKLQKSSGNDSWDKEALQALNQAAPFYPPPEYLSGGLNVELSFAFGKGASWSVMHTAAAQEKDTSPSMKASSAAPISPIRLSLDLNATLPLPKRPPTSGPSVSAQADVDFGPYMADLQRRIMRAWFPTKGEESKRVVVVFKIHRGGELSHLRLDRSSGTTIADQAGLKAIVNAAPFRPLPDGAPEDVDIQFTFDYNVFGGGQRGTFRQF